MPSKPASTPNPSSSPPRNSPTSSNSSTNTTSATIPTTPEARSLVDDLIYGEWLKRRLRAAETQIWAYDHQENYRPDPKYPLGQTAASRGKAFAQLQWRIECTRRASRQALQDLQQLQAEAAARARSPNRRRIRRRPSVTPSPQTTSPQIGFVLHTPPPDAPAAPEPSPHPPVLMHPTTSPDPASLQLMPRQSGFPSRGRYNRRMRRLLLLLAACAIASAQKKPFDVNALMELKRIGDPQISPDGSWVAFTVQTVDVAANKKPQQIWVVPLEGGDAPRRSRRTARPTSAPRWSPDSKRIAYISDRGGSSQIWMMDPDGANAQAGHQSVHRGRWPYLFARRQEPRLHQRGLSRMRRRRCLQQEESRRGKGQQGQGADLHRTALPPLDQLAGASAAATDGRPCRRRRRPRPHARQRATCRPSPSAAATITTSRPTARKSATRMNADPMPATSTNSDLYVVSIAGGEPRQDHHHPGRRFQPALFARRQVHRLARAVPRRL